MNVFKLGKILVARFLYIKKERTVFKSQKERMEIIVSLEQFNLEYNVFAICFFDKISFLKKNKKKISYWIVHYSTKKRNPTPLTVSIFTESSSEKYFRKRLIKTSMLRPRK